MKKYFALAFFILGFIFLIGCGGEKENEESAIFFATSDELVASVKPEVEMISMSEFKTLYDNRDPFVMIDVRTGSEHNNGYIPYAVSIPRGVLEFKIGDDKVWDKEGMYTPLKDDFLVVYCKSGGRSVLSAKALGLMGYSNVKWLEGGWVKWKENYPDIFDTSIPDGAAPVAEDAGGC